LWGYLKRVPGESTEVAPALMHLAWSSPAALAIAPLQDLLNLGRGTRMNVPGRADGNWRWRSPEDMPLAAFQWLQDLTYASKRSIAPAIPLTSASIKTVV
jgi:4-alpha-glucanotransferase